MTIPGQEDCRNLPPVFRAGVDVIKLFSLLLTFRTKKARVFALGLIWYLRVRPQEHVHNLVQSVAPPGYTLALSGVYTMAIIALN